MNNFFIIFIAIFLTVSCSTNNTGSCLERKAAIDIGSGSTKLVAAIVDTCKKEIESILLEKSYPIQYKESIDKNNGMIGIEQIQQGHESFKLIKSELAKLKITNVKGVATSAFRKALNGSDIIHSYAKKYKIRLNLISQEKEAFYGLLAAKKFANDSDSYVVWDIGGGSMQITLKDQDDIIQYFGNLASVSFKKEVLLLQGSKKSSPNPIGEHIAEKSLLIAKNFAKNNISPKLLNLSRNIKVFGIGGVHYYSVKGQTKTKDFYQLEDITKAIKKNAMKTDQEIGGNYASTDVTNLILVKGFMNAMGIDKVWPIKINMGHGILLH